MKTTQFAMFACALTLFTQPILSAHADVTVAPVDRSATAMQNSGATYDHHDRVTASAKQAASATDRAMNDTSRMTNRRVAQDHAAVPVTNVDANAKTITQDGVAMNAMPDQQQQQVAPTHSTTPWLLFLLAVIVGGAIFYTSKRRDLPARGRY